MSHHTNSQATILVVDDEQNILDDIVATLTKAGHSCIGCNDSQSVKETLLTMTPDLMISDINLGGENGLLLCEEIKEQPGLEQLPVIILSGADIPDIVRRSYEAGGNYYLRKPYDPNVLLDIVDKALWMPHLVSSRVKKPKMAAKTIKINSIEMI